MALPAAVEVGGNHANFGCNAHGTAVVGIYTRAFLAEAAVIKTKHGNRCAHHIHGIRSFRRGLDKIHHTLGEVAFGTQLGAEFLKLRTIRQSAMPEQIDHLLVGGLAGELVYIVTTIDENSFASTHVTQTGRVRDDSFESFCGNWHKLIRGFSRL